VSITSRREGRRDSTDVLDIVELYLLNIAEQPARLQLDDRWLLAEWKPAYKRGYIMQASLVVVGGALGLARCRQLADKR
jgi:hypothetical protein